MHAAGDDPGGLRLRALIVVLWRAGLRISEALALLETDLDESNSRLASRPPPGAIARCPRTGLARAANGACER
jgi:site-specific recombinase XerD